MTGLVFETARAPQSAHPNRMDVVLFAGFVARRKTALPADVRESLRVAGWIDGAWAKPASEIEALLQVPVIVESWDAFDRLYAWRQRPLGNNGSVCTSTLGAAVRSYFSGGGRRALIVRAGDPWSYLESETDRSTAKNTRLLALGIDVNNAAPFDPNTPESWRGLQHLYGLGEVSLLCLPDLPELHALAINPATPPEAQLAPDAPEIFVECSSNEPALARDTGLSTLPPPQLDTAAYTAWVRALNKVRDFLATRRRDAIFVGALPLASSEARSSGIYAQADMAAFLPTLPGYSDADGKTGIASAFLQLAWPWLRTQRSNDLPGDLEPGDGLLAAAIAAKALSAGSFRSIAGTALPEVIETIPAAAWGLDDSSPAARLATLACLVAPEPGGGFAWQSDVTTSRSPAWRPGGSSRLMTAVLRAARRAGETLVFESSGPVLWSRLRRTLEATLTGFWQAGGLGGATPEEAFTVRCDRSTMSQNDIDAGRLIVAISVLPAAALERITVVLDLGSAGASVSLREVA